jgi:uncharacterized protein YybS (DUF2232 family)
MENKRHNTRAIVEAGLLSAITVVLMLITIYIPVLDVVGTFILPIPITLMYIRHDAKITLTGIAASALIVSVLFNPIKAIALTVMFGLTGLTLGYCIKKDKKPTTAILFLTIATIIVLCFNVTLTALVVDKTSIANSITKTIKLNSDLNIEAMEMAKGVYTKIGAPKETIESFEKFRNMFDVNFLLSALGGMLIIGSAFSAIVNYVVTKAILTKLGYEVKRLPLFSELYIGSFAGIFIVVPVFIGTFLSSKNIPVGNSILVSGNIIMQITFLFIGISIVTYYLKNKYRLPKGIVTLIVLFLAFNPIFTTILTYVGLLDMIIDFRKINPNRVLRR